MIEKKYMIYINNPNSFINRIWKSGTEKKNEQYRFLRYVVQVRHKGYLLLHNCITGELIAINQEEEKNLFNNVKNEFFCTLIRRHFIVPLDYNEYEIVKTLRKIVAALKEKNVFTSYTILPTTNCNARCFYCYENGVQKRTMDRETADRLISFIETHSGSKRHVHLDWFGGEPTLCSNLITYICEELKKKKIDYYSSMTSNGFLFSDKMVYQAKEIWKMKRVQISLDGTHEIYKKTKAYISNPDNPLENVINNIHLLKSAGINVYIRLNLDIHNYLDMQDLTCRLISEFRNSDNVSVYVSLLTEGKETKRIEHTNCDSQLIDESKYQIEEELREYGLLYTEPYLPSLRINACNADNIHSILVTPDGFLNKCDNSFDVNTIGNLDSDEFNYENLEKWNIREEYSCMKTCQLSPWCVNLKMCPFSHKCSDELLNYKISNIQKRMIECFEKYQC